MIDCITVELKVQLQFPKYRMHFHFCVIIICVRVCVLYVGCQLDGHPLLSL